MKRFYKERLRPRWDASDGVLYVGQTLAFSLGGTPMDDEVRFYGVAVFCWHAQRLRAVWFGLSMDRDSQ